MPIPHSPSRPQQRLLRPIADDVAFRRTQAEDDMRLTVRTFCLLIAVILFVIAAFGVDVRGISLQALGLAFFAAAFLLPDTVLGRRA